MIITQASLQINSEMDLYIHIQGMIHIKNLLLHCLKCDIGYLENDTNHGYIEGKDLTVNEKSKRQKSLVCSHCFQVVLIIIMC